jgi:S1-C subfamily serine protease|tara:strand:- start:22893 stop:24059 length:1167 start_codon:yes stop_codon:yes gene_type:complete
MQWLLSLIILLIFGFLGVIASDSRVYLSKSPAVSDHKTEEVVSLDDTEELGEVKSVVDEETPLFQTEQTDKTEVILEVTPDAEETEAVVFEEIPSIPEPQMPVSFSAINTEVRESLVNILCTTKFGGSLKPSSGSGVIIDERGVILTNAHLAQYLLIKDYQVPDFLNCVIRVGSPAKPRYKARLLHISSEWILNNTDNITSQNPRGTGEDDYALLYITDTVDKNGKLPDKFPTLSFEIERSGILQVGEQVLTAAYPAGFLGGISIQRDLFASSAVTAVMELFTFKEGTLDLFSIGGSVVAQKGASGGAVVDTKSRVVGIIVTTSLAETTAERDLRAITLSHINKSIVEELGVELTTLLAGNLENTANIFELTRAQSLINLLEEELDNS